MPLVVSVAAGTTTPVAAGSVRLEYVPAEAGATVTEVRVYADPARTGTPVDSGVPMLVGGSYVFDATLTDGDYYTAFDVSDSTGSYTDRGDFFLVVDGEIVQTIVSLAEVLRHLFSTDGRFSTADLEEARQRDSGEIVLLMQAATPVIEEKAGAVLARTVTQHLNGPVLKAHPVVSVVSVSGVSGVLTGTGDLDSEAGLLTSLPFGATTVTYVVGRPVVPANIRKAVLTWIAYWWRREHGGSSDGYLPQDGIGVPGGVMGVTALDRQIDALLGPDRRGMRVA